jgi:hypothetical protein
MWDEKGGYGFNFPKFIGEVTEDIQVDKIVEEAEEYRIEVRNGDRLKAGVELLDIIHACETRLRQYTTQEILACKAHVLEKNGDRGYYDKETTGMVRVGKLFRELEIGGGEE